jgi:hypothetical protein
MPLGHCLAANKKLRAKSWASRFGKVLGRGLHQPSRINKVLLMTSEAVPAALSGKQINESTLGCYEPASIVLGISTRFALI